MPRWAWTPPTSTTMAAGPGGPRHAARAGKGPQDIRQCESFDVYNLKLEAGYHPQYAVTRSSSTAATGASVRSGIRRACTRPIGAGPPCSPTWTTTATRTCSSPTASITGERPRLPRVREQPRCAIACWRSDPPASSRSASGAARPSHRAARPARRGCSRTRGSRGRSAGDRCRGDEQVLVAVVVQVGEQGWPSSNRSRTRPPDTRSH